MNIGKQIAALKRMTLTELRRKHIETFGEPTGSGHKDYLAKRIDWLLQAEVEGACRWAEQLANNADLRTHAPPKQACNDTSGLTASTTSCFDQDLLVPLPGSILTRRYKVRGIIVKVRPLGFEFEGRFTSSLSAVTGTHRNGYHFFNLGQNGVADE